MPKTGAALDRFVTNSTSFSPVEDRIRPQVIYQPKGKHDEKKPCRDKHTARTTHNFCMLHTKLLLP